MLAKLFSHLFIYFCTCRSGEIEALFVVLNITRGSRWLIAHHANLHCLFTFQLSLKVAMLIVWKFEVFKSILAFFGCWNINLNQVDVLSLNRKKKISCEHEHELI